MRTEHTPKLFIYGAAFPDQVVAILVSFGCEMKQKRPAGIGFSLGEQTFPDHSFDGAMNYGAIEAEELGDLILVERGAAAEGGKNEAARGRASGFLFKPLGDRKIGLRDVSNRRISQNLGRNRPLVYGDHRTSTVA